MIHRGLDDQGDIGDSAAAGRDGNRLAGLDAGCKLQSPQLAFDGGRDFGDRNGLGVKALADAKNVRVSGHRWGKKED